MVPRSYLQLLLAFNIQGVKYSFCPYQQAWLWKWHLNNLQRLLTGVHVATPHLVLLSALLFSLHHFPLLLFSLFWIFFSLNIACIKLCFILYYIHVILVDHSLISLFQVEHFTLFKQSSLISRYTAYRKLHIFLIFHWGLWTKQSR